MSLFEIEKSMSFDEYIASFDAERVAKAHDFVDWLAQYQGVRTAKRSNHVYGSGHYWWIQRLYGSYF